MSDDLNIPEEGDIWRHYKGAEYIVRGLSNTNPRKTPEQERKHPVIVEYMNRHTKEKYARPLSDWHRSMTFVGRNEEKD